MRTPHEIIVHAIRFDHNPTSNAQRIIGNLRDEGYEIVPSRELSVDLPEIRRMFGKSVVSADECAHWIGRAFDMGAEQATRIVEEAGMSYVTDGKEIYEQHSDRWVDNAGGGHGSLRQSNPPRRLRVVIVRDITSDVEDDIVARACTDESCSRCNRGGVSTDVWRRLGDVRASRLRAAA